MGLRDVLADFLSSEGSHDRAGRDDASGGSASNSGDAQGDDEDGAESAANFEVELEELDQEEQVEALEGRLEEMEGTIEQKHSELETIKGSQQDVAEQLNEVNDTVRQLLGIYDQLTADVNPFMDGPTRDADPDAEGFGVVGGEEPDPDGEVVEAVVEGDAVADDADADADDADDEDDEATEEAAGTVGLDDLRAEYEASREEDDATGDDAPDGGDESVEPGERTVVEAVDEPGDEAAVAADEAAAAADDGADAAEAAVVPDDVQDNKIEVEPTSAGDEMSESDAFRSESGWRDDVPATGAPRGRAAVTLGSLADTYATEIIAFEWLTSLVSTAGPAATLRAIAYYEEIGWISPRVKTYLEDVLSGPDLDMNVDPSRDPSELTAEDHAESYEYIMKLDAVQRTIDDTGL